MTTGRAAPSVIRSSAGEPPRPAGGEGRSGAPVARDLLSQARQQRDRDLGHRDADHQPGSVDLDPAAIGVGPEQVEHRAGGEAGDMDPFYLTCNRGW